MPCIAHLALHHLLVSRIWVLIDSGHVSITHTHTPSTQMCACPAQPTPAPWQSWGCSQPRLLMTILSVHNQVENWHAVHWIWAGFSRHRQWHYHSSHPDSASSKVTLIANVTQIAHEHTMPRQPTCSRGYLYCLTIGLHS